jgi:hypothetical protein
VQVEADVLLVDEVLAVGDAAFQRKCFDQFERMKAEGRTILFVTHDMGAIERFCDRAMLIERGRVVDIGPPGEIAREYGEINHGQIAGVEGAGGGSRILTAWCEGADGERVVSRAQGEMCTACVELEFIRDVEDPQLTITFRNGARHTIFVATTARHPSLGRFRAGERAIVRFTFQNWLAPSRYTLTPSLASAEGADRRDDLASLIVEGDMSGGVADLPTELELERL